jgi:hypothetical protein
MMKVYNIFELIRDVIMEKKLWETSVNFLDIYSNAPQKFKDRVDKMSNEELEKFIDENKHSWGKGLDWGMNTGSDVVLKTIAENSKWNELEEDMDQEETHV